MASATRGSYWRGTRSSPGWPPLPHRECRVVPRCGSLPIARDAFCIDRFRPAPYGSPTVPAVKSSKRAPRGPSRSGWPSIEEPRLRPAYDPEATAADGRRASPKSRKPPRWPCRRPLSTARRESQEPGCGNRQGDQEHHALAANPAIENHDIVGEDPHFREVDPGGWPEETATKHEQGSSKQGFDRNDAREVGAGRKRSKNGGTEPKPEKEREKQTVQNPGSRVGCQRAAKPRKVPQLSNEGRGFAHLEASCAAIAGFALQCLSSTDSVRSSTASMATASQFNEYSNALAPRRLSDSYWAGNWICLNPPWTFSQCAAQFAGGEHTPAERNGLFQMSRCPVVAA
jgi:hypothetical protein